ncbi:unnamed protein product [Acanthosepion pharaonis]|uniref:Uncharacterized protein n=1 Tax=Acanthosepion pharaonis TaxID=158019 RepID=A0A812BZU4_ACAPH|nr:unnamed protein product [Sepia pharaonis]
MTSFMNIICSSTLFFFLAHSLSFSLSLSFFSLAISHCLSLSLCFSLSPVLSFSLTLSLTLFLFSSHAFSLSLSLSLFLSLFLFSSLAFSLSFILSNSLCLSHYFSFSPSFSLFLSTSLSVSLSSQRDIQKCAASSCQLPLPFHFRNKACPFSSFSCQPSSKRIARKDTCFLSNKRVRYDLVTLKSRERCSSEEVLFILARLKFNDFIKVFSIDMSLPLSNH